MTRTTLARLMFLPLLQGLAVAACGDDGSTVPTVTGPSPTSPSPTGATSTGSGPVSGSVQDTAYRPLAGALVEVLDGPQAGTSTRAGASGEFSFPGTFDDATRFQASMPDHVAATRTVSLRPRRWIAFELAPLVPPVAMSGEYTLTITADPVCAELPPDARTRTYAASARSIPEYSGTYFDVTLSGASLLDAFDRSERASMAVAGDYVALWFGGDEQPALVERLSTTSYVAFSARASATVGVPASSLTTAFSGFIDYCEMRSVTDLPIDGYSYSCAPEKALAHVRCAASGHRLVLARH